MRVLAVPDKFRGTATAEQVCAAIAVAVVAAGSSCRSLPIADGGEGMLEAFGGPNRLTVVTGPAGGPVSAGWRMNADGLAVIESAQACGLLLTGGAAANDPVAATTRGVGELIVAALVEGAARILVGLGGSATKLLNTNRERTSGKGQGATMSNESRQLSHMSARDMKLSGAVLGRVGVAAPVLAADERLLVTVDATNCVPSLDDRTAKDA